MADKLGRARELLENGSFVEAALAFQASGDFSSAASAFVCAKDFRNAAECHVKARKLIDAARLFMLVKEWQRAADLFLMSGDKMRAELALQQLEKKDEKATVKTGAAVPAAPPPPSNVEWPQGEIWALLKAGDIPGASRAYLQPGARSGWTLLDEARLPETQKALGEMLCEARDYTVAADVYRRSGDDTMAARCFSQAGLNEEAADLFMRSGDKVSAAQHLEKARAWEQAASIYVDEQQYTDAARCHERNDDPVKAAALYLKAKKADTALPLLQGVAPSHRSFAQCRLLAGKILFQKGEKELAHTLLAPLFKIEMKGDESLETFYQLALLMEQAGEVEKALDLYLSLQKIRFDLKDITSRIEKLKKSRPQEPPPPPPQAITLQPLQPLAEQFDMTPLRDCSLFHRLDLGELRRLQQIGRVIECNQVKVVLDVGQKSEGLYILLTGGLMLTPDPRNPNLAVGFLSPGAYIGLGSILMGPPQANAAVAKAGTKMLLLPSEALEHFLATEPSLAARLFRSIAEHLVQTLMAVGPRK